MKLNAETKNLSRLCYSSPCFSELLSSLLSSLPSSSLEICRDITSSDIFSQSEDTTKHIDKAANADAPIATLVTCPIKLKRKRYDENPANGKVTKHDVKLHIVVDSGARF
mmetsp:Transcript_5365/g.15581  ORF Transcript_5365/g.15581 Transcript_5365/m.15581 type:complete len:110 (-) Transcript_5365:2001-2330(-)